MTATYLDEILEQPAMLTALSRGLPNAVIDALEQVRRDLAAGAYDRIVITAMGGSLHGAYPLYLRLSQSQPLPVVVVDASELVQQIPQMISAGSLMIAISQSGESGEIVEITRNLARRPRTAVAVTNLAGNSLDSWADIGLASNAGPEATVSSKSYTGGVACLHLLAAALEGTVGEAAGELAKAALACRQLMSEWRAPIDSVAGFIDAKAPVVYVGRGRSLGSANLAALLSQEAAKLPCTALSGGQFRHGPIELVRDGFQMIMFLGDRGTRTIDEALVSKVLACGGHIVAVSPAALQPAPADGLHVFSYPDVPMAMNPIMEAVFVQLLQIPLAAARGFVAGQFFNATKVTAVV